MTMRCSVSLGSLAAICFLSGCATHTGTGALAGGAIGAGTGAAIGSVTGNAGVGALVGSGIGALTGGLVGAGLDENDQRNQARIAAATAQPQGAPLSLPEVVNMSRSGVGDEVIVASIQSSNTVFQLPPASIVELHQQGVSDRVIQAMMDSSRRPVVARAAPVVYESPVYVVEPPPRVVLGVGYGCYGHRRHCW